MTYSSHYKVSWLSALQHTIVLGSDTISPGTNTYLIGRGQQRILIDTGEGARSWATSLKSLLSEENATVQQVLLTHWHGDHVGGISDLKRLCPQVIVHKHDPEDGQEDIHDGQVFCVEGATLKACHTPGHTYDHMAFIVEEEDALITGDSEVPSLSCFRSLRLFGLMLIVFLRVFVDVLGQGTSVFEDLQAYLGSLQRMRTRASGRGYPGHGPVIEKVPAKISEYLQHRQQREEEVIRVLRYGSLDVEKNGGTTPEQQEKQHWTPLELVKKIYRDVPESLHLPASHGVLQVLMKLEDEGRTVHDSTSGGWSLKAEKSAL